MNRRNKRLVLISLVLAMIVVVVVVVFVPPLIETSASNNFESKILPYLSGIDGWDGDNIYFTYYNSTHYSTTSTFNEVNNYTPAHYLTASEIAILNNYTQISPSTFLNDVKAATNTMYQATDYGRGLFLLNITRVEDVFYLQYVSHDTVGFPSINARCIIYY
jgi:hypothetical protein